MKTQKGMKTLIRNWVNRETIKKFEAESCPFSFEDNDNRSFYSKYDAVLYDCLHYSGEFYDMFIESFDKIFKGTGWSYDYEDASVIIVYKEDSK